MHRGGGAVARGVFIALGTAWGLGQGVRDRLCVPYDLNKLCLQEYGPCPVLLPVCATRLRFPQSPLGSKSKLVRCP